MDRPIADDTAHQPTGPTAGRVGDKDTLNIVIIETRRKAGLYLGIGAVALLIVGSVAWVSGKTGSSLTQALPEPASPSAAVMKLPPPNLLKPISPEEAVKENAERPFVKRPDTAAAQFMLRTDAGGAERALTCLTQAVYYEAAGEGVEGGRAVAQVVLNRMRHPGYPASVCGVVYQGSERATGCQFSFTCDGSLLRAPVASLWARSRKIAQDALSGKVFAGVGHATHYHADYVLPYWADSLDKTIQIGRHIFYRFRSTPGDSRSFFQRYAGSEPPIPAPRSKVQAVVLAEPDEEKLAKVLIGEDVKGAGPDAEKIALPTTPLLADASRSVLAIDDVVVPTSAKRKPATDCPAPTESKRLRPLAPNDVRSGATAC